LQNETEKVAEKDRFRRAGQKIQAMARIVKKTSSQHEIQRPNQKSQLAVSDEQSSGKYIVPGSVD
jgi:hypothetical protein